MFNLVVFVSFKIDQDHHDDGFTLKYDKLRFVTI